MSSTEATTADGETIGTTETRDSASSAAERLGGPTERQQDQDMARESERSTDMAEETDQRAETASNAETDDSQADSGQADSGQADSGAEPRATLIAPEQAETYNGRWNDLKSEFVDDPRTAVRGANSLVGEVLDELEELFRSQRADLEHGLDSEQTTTEDLRQALGRYRSFFDRLLSF
jgi:hypothetical protein